VGFQIQITSALTNAILAKPLPSLYEADIDAVADGLERSLFTSLHLVKASTSGKPDAMISTYIARIEEVNDVLRPVTEINPDALIIAAALDKERSEGMVRGLVCKLGSLRYPLTDRPLHGIPVLIKDTVRWTPSKLMAPNRPLGN
jgi:amidase